MNAKKILLASIAVWLTGFVYYMSVNRIFLRRIYDLTPNIWRPAIELSSPYVMIGVSLFGFSTAVFFTVIYAFIYKGIPGEGLQKGLMYGLFAWLLGPYTVNGMLAHILIVSPRIIGYWLLSNAVAMILMGVIVSAIYKEE
ncbi:hypothetical protein ACFLZ2_02075 [Candidatus Margulisiibacteriota bacterium]